jgi:hypothetical protein
MAALKQMLEELNPNELMMVEDFIVNFCEDSYVDENGNPPNIFRMIITDNR